MPGSTIRISTNVTTETSFFRNDPMNPHCPNCLKEMTKASASRSLYNCEPCREIIQYFGGGADHCETGPHFSWPVRRKRAVHTAHAV
ncbi:ribosomal protein S27E [Bradyrhizobium sp. USDA 4486]